MTLVPQVYAAVHCQTSLYFPICQLRALEETVILQALFLDLVPGLRARSEQKDGQNMKNNGCISLVGKG
jgi:hypothetical protein